MRKSGRSTNFGGDINQQPVDLEARNRLEILDAGTGSLAIFPSPPQILLARENEVNLGYVYYRKYSDNGFSLGAMAARARRGLRSLGVSDEVWDRRVRVARSQIYNYASTTRLPHHAAHGCLLLPERPRAPPNPAAGDGLLRTTTP